MADSTTNFTKLVPGFDFLQGLVKNAGSALPQIGQWVAPTLDPDELEKRIEELRTVQFWLEQNSKMLSATIQALEVQRMTLSTLKTMNVQVNDLRESMKLPERAAPAAAAEPAAKKRSPRMTPTAAGPAGVVDPMQWWGALTKQFTELAAGALKDGAGPAATSLASNMVKQSMDAAQQTLGATKKAAAKPARRTSKAGAAKPRKAASR